jgi:hypothetical protein
MAIRMAVGSSDGNTSISKAAAGGLGDGDGDGDGSGAAAAEQPATRTTPRRADSGSM